MRTLPPLQLLPEGFALPPLAYLFALAAALAAVGYGVAERDPAFGERHVLALVPWICVGAAGHVLYVVGALPPALRPLFGTPAAYLTTAALAGAAWLAALAADRDTGRARGDGDARLLAAAGCLALVAVLARVAAYGATTGTGTLSPVLPAVGLLGGATLGLAAGWLLVRVYDPAAVTGAAGALAVTAHGVDGVTTAVGVDLLGYGERTPLSRVIIEFAAGLPTAEALGAGWLFVLVKLAVGCVVVALVAPVVEEAPREGNALLAFVAAVGLGPGVHNALLFAVAGG